MDIISITVYELISDNICQQLIFLQKEKRPGGREFILSIHKNIVILFKTHQDYNALTLVNFFKLS